MSQFFRLLLGRWGRFVGFGDENPAGAQTRSWFAFAMLYTAVCAGLALRQSFASDYVVADDVRQHVFWMFRFVDPTLFPHDPIADYFQSIAPPGFSVLYRGLAALGIAPLLASKLIPPVLGLLVAGYLFGVSLRILRSPAAAALATILLCQALWLSTDLCSATPRAFFYPLFAAFLYYHASSRRLCVLVTILLQGLFFPPAALISLGVLALDLVRFKNGWPTLPTELSPYLFCACALGVAMLTLLPYLQTAGKFGPLISYAEARQMSEFAPGGRVPFFYPGFWDYWMHGSAGLHIQSRPFWLFAAFLWPILRWLPMHFPLLNRVAARGRPLPQVAGSALVLFAASHATLFHLYLPSRYTQHTARVLFAIAAGGVIMAMADALWRCSSRRGESARFVSAFGALTLSISLLVAVVFLPFFHEHFPRAGYITGKAPDLYRFFCAQPSTTKIASIADEANDLPVFSHRSIIIGVETAVPFHPGYYRPLRQRGLQLARAQYTNDLGLLQQCIRDLHIDFWVLDQGAFTPVYLANNRLLRQLKVAVPSFGPGVPSPFLERPPPKCVVFADAHFVVVDARAVLALSPRQLTAQ